MPNTRDQFTETWRYEPFKHRGMKYILYCPDEMLDFIDIMKMYRNIFATKIYDHVIDQKISIKEVTQKNFAQKFSTEFKEPLIQDGLWKARQRRSIVSNAAQGYVSYYNRNKKIPAQAICIKDTKAVFFQDGIFVDTTPEKRNGIMEISIHGEKKRILVKYSIPKGMFEYKKHINVKKFKQMGGNFFTQNGSHIFMITMEIPFQWKYEPVDTLAFDLNKEDRYFLYFSKAVTINGKTKRIFSQPKESKIIIDELKKINQDINNATTSKERQKLRYKSKNLHKSLNTYCYHICEQIVDYVEKKQLLLCIDDLSCGKSTGSFGQDKIVSTLARMCENKCIPFVKVPTPYTSKTCYKCGEKGERNGNEFVCNNDKCEFFGLKKNPHENASINIANFGYDIWLNGDKKYQKNKDKVVSRSETQKQI